MPGSKWRVVADAKDLKPLRVRLFRCTERFSSARSAQDAERAAARPFGAHRRAYVGRGRPGSP
jgi:hypothetical protein